MMRVFIGMTAAVIAVLATGPRLDARPVKSRAQQSFSCSAPAPIPFAPRLGSQADESDPTRTRLDPVKAAEQAPLRSSVVAPVARIVGMADAYRASRSPDRRDAIAACIDRHFAALAAARSFEGVHNSTDQFYRSWMIARLAVARLKLGPDHPMSEAVAAWFRDNADGVLAFQDQRIERGQIQNHLYWGGFALAAVGELLGEPRYLGFADRIFRIGVGNIDQDGLLAAEAARAGRARHYHLFAAAPLAGIALVTHRRLSADEAGRMSQLASAVAESFAEPDGGRIARAAKMAQSAEARTGSLHLLKPFARDPATRDRLDRLTHGVEETDPFMGGRLDFLIGG